MTTTTPSRGSLAWVATALAGAERVVEAELSDAVTYIRATTLAGKSDDEIAEREITLAMDSLQAIRDNLREKRFGWERFGACAVPFSVSSHFTGEQA